MITDTSRSRSPRKAAIVEGANGRPWKQTVPVNDMTAMIQIHGPHDGKFVAQFLTADGRSLAIFVPEAQAEVLRDLQASMPYGLAVRDLVDATA